MQKKYVKVKMYVCQHCGHNWKGRGNKTPIVCPKPTCHRRL